jgi:hypothetical protein
MQRVIKKVRENPMRRKKRAKMKRSRKKMRMGMKKKFKQLRSRLLEIRSSWAPLILHIIQLLKVTMCKLLSMMQLLVTIMLSTSL